MSGMADVIAAHNGYNTLHSGDWTTTVTWHAYCEGRGCDWHEKLEGKASAEKAHAAHVADELTKAGFGSVRDAEAAAFEHAAVNIETYPLAEQYHPARAHLANHFRTKAVAWRQS